MILYYHVNVAILIIWICLIICYFMDGDRKAMQSRMERACVVFQIILMTPSQMVLLLFKFIALIKLRTYK